MSEMEAHKGKLVPILNLPGTSAEDDAKEICRRLGIEMPHYLDNWVETLEDEGYRKVVYRKGVWYSIQGERKDEIGEFVEGHKNPDGSYHYYVYYYNGGASLDEVLTEAMEKADKEAT